MTRRRADFEQNRERLITAAVEIFAEQGMNAPLDAIAHRAEVGRATLYRHFPDRHALAAALFEREIAFLEREVAKMPEGPDLLFHMLGLLAIELGRYGEIADYLRSQERSAPMIGETVGRFLALFEPMIEDAKAAGLARADMTTRDVLLIGMTLSAVRATPEGGEHGSARLFELLLDSLRPRE